MQASSKKLVNSKQKTRPSIKTMFLYKYGVIGRMFDAQQVTPVEMDSEGILFYSANRYTVGVKLMLSLDSGHEKLMHLMCKIEGVDHMDGQYRCRLNFEFHLWKQHSVDAFKQLLLRMSESR